MKRPSPTAKRIFSGSAWGIFAKILDAGAKFVTIPLLVGFYGKGDYGLIALAFSLNAYLRLMDLGMNVGSVKFLSQWEAKGDWDSISKASRSGVIFYGLIGLVNAAVFLFMAFNGSYFFKLSPEQIPTYRTMMIILSFSTIPNWLSNVVVQLLSAKDELAHVNRSFLASSLVNFGVALAAIYFEWSLPVYFLGYTLATLLPVPLNILRLRTFPIRVSHLLLPKWDAAIFKEIIGYSAAIFLMGIFQLTANELRPILLARYASSIDVLTDYRVIQTIAMLVISFGSIFLQVLLPSASKIYGEGNQEKIERMVLEATRYISLFLCFVVFILILNSSDLLGLYMGPDYLYLAPWLNLWLLTVLLNMHNTPVASLVLSSGKTKALIYSSAISCLVSLPITVMLAPTVNVGAAVLGYLVYMAIQIGFFYAYYIPKVLNLHSWKILTTSFFPALSAGLLAFGGAYALQYWLGFGDSPWLSMTLQSAVFSLIFLFCLLLWVIRREEKLLLSSYLKRLVQRYS
ncbi:oligosaccharide flippase family protein [Algoriphagus sp. H41]|uniref:Oligosaccharide flippase family protein n=1 Tax=Algoriphagus oliviformis TaxID=2811231 RepID=A0ABS3BWT7_9BACT|nr:oligosaccharide flippase family protein [Algoriphagus oliviformis]MBN7809332.1 oligosaccharide flippase family protein [Algoriphagus oliviformis]